ncbi:hypothetical protein SSPO_041030 [Streptomyces antimycoticus]|uniref:Plasmid replication initiator protein n=1 Tax=Streptomyces antimycoticus TaxID=68175 RepID=A0A499UHY0_9ACTN|nr:hypothetical protein SSPO_041030 [Streptomyces antimycoticus]
MSDASRVHFTRSLSTACADRSAELVRERRLRLLSEADRDTVRLAQDPGFTRWLEQIKAIGGCAHPIYLSGSTITRDAHTGEVLSAYSTADEPGERLAVRCRNRRATVCAPCSRLHAGDTFHLVRSGLTGGKTVPEAVRDRPRLFVTLTAPGFGPVHRIADDDSPCRPRRDRPRCAHGTPLSCSLTHSEGDPLTGQPVCPACYDYPGHVLWHAHAGRLWDRFTTAVRRHLDSAAGVPRSRLGAHLMVSFAKAAEYQQRAAIHFHAVVRLDGPSGPGAAPPSWATPELLTDAVRAAAASVTVRVPESAAYGAEVLSWGAQIDVRPIRSFDDGAGVSDDAVAAYVAKYVAKGAADTAAGLDHRVSGPEDIRTAQVSGRVRALMGTCCGAWAACQNWKTCGCARGLTRSATGDISSPSPGVTPPPTPRYALNARTISAPAPRQPRNLTRSRKRLGATSVPATPPARPSSPLESPKTSPGTEK